MSFRDISSRPSDQKKQLYEQSAQQLIQKKDVDNIGALVEHLVQREGSDQYGRTYIVPSLLSTIIHLLADPEGTLEDPIDVEDLTPLMKRIVELIRPRAEDYPESLMNALDLYAKCHQANGDFKSAALALGSFKFDEFRGKLTVPVDRRVSWHVDCASFWLAADETGSASQQIKRAHGLIAEVKGNQQLLLKFKTVYAQVLDAERKFLEASLRYLELSQQTSAATTGLVTEQDLLQSLEYSITCAILAKAGPPRSRVLAMLYSDERSKQLTNYGMLEKMFKERIISPTEVTKFESLLSEHQQASTANGRTVLQNAVIEHNLLAASKIYNNCKIEELGRLLFISPGEAEKLSSQMIEQGRLMGTIDQIQGLVEFKDASSSSSDSSSLSLWDQQIRDLCLVVNAVSDRVTSKYPQYQTY